MATPSRSDNIALAVMAILISVLGLSLGDALIKLISGDFILWQIFVLRSGIVLPLLVGYLIVWAPGALAWPPAAGWIVLRSFLMVVMWVAYYIALPHLNIAVAAAAYYTSPLFIILFSALLLGDRIRPLTWAAVALGFAGVLLILRPQTGDFNIYALLPLISAVLYALSTIVTRSRCRAVHPIVLAAGLNAGFIVAGVLATIILTAFGLHQADSFLLGVWTSMGQAEWLSIASLACAILLGSVGAAIAYQKGPPAKIGVFDFAYVGFAVLWGAVFFAEWPDVRTIIGMALIVTAGILSLRP